MMKWKDLDFSNPAKKFPTQILCNWSRDNLKNPNLQAIIEAFCKFIEQNNPFSVSYQALFFENGQYCKYFAFILAEPDNEHNKIIMFLPTTSI